MKIRNLILIFAMVFIINIINTEAYQNCTPSACSADYSDEGITCNETTNTCTRKCSLLTCGNESAVTWTQEFSDTMQFQAQESWKQYLTNGYTATNQSKCYKYAYEGTDYPDSYIKMDLTAGAPANCYSEGIVGLRDDTSPTSPWYSDIDCGDPCWLGPKHIGTVGQSILNNMLKLARGHAEGDATSTYRNELSSSNYVYCANSSKICTEFTSWYCTTGCFNRNTKLRVVQGGLNDSGTPDSTLYDADECGDSVVESGGNYFDTESECCAGYYVYSTPTNVTTYDNKQCDMTNEAPSASGVKVLPENATAGNDLLCNYTYSDPENFEERDSTYEWWKNGANQNINLQLLGKGNLTPNNGWYCKVTPNDGLTNGTKVQSSNTVNISSTIQSPIMYVDNTAVWNSTGYFEEETVLNFNQELENALDSCTADADGYCNISLTFSSDAIGLLNLTDMEIYYESSEADVSNISISSLSSIYSSGTYQIFEMIILNNGNLDLTNISWTINLGDSNTAQSTYNFNLTSNEQIFVFIEHNYSSTGSYNVIVNATAGNISASRTESIDVGDLIITSFDDIYSDKTIVIFEAIVKNALDINITNINWTLDTGDENTIYSNKLFNLTPNETIFVYVEHNYTQTGDYAVTATVTNSTYIGEKTINIGFGVGISNLTTLNISDTKAIFEFWINNYLTANLTNVSFQFDTKDNNIINSTKSINLTPDETIFVYFEYNFTSSGTYNVNATAINGSLKDSINYTLIVS